MLYNVESNSLGEGAALTNSHYVTFRHVAEGRGAVSRQVAMSLLKTEKEATRSDTCP